jgi:hypothetical protein
MIFPIIIIITGIFLLYFIIKGIVAFLAEARSGKGNDLQNKRGYTGKNNLNDFVPENKKRGITNSK